MKNIVISNGYFSSLKWNGRLFSDGISEYSRIVLPIEKKIELPKEGKEILTKINVIFLKNYQEGEMEFNGSSLVFEIKPNISLEKIQKFFTSDILWAFKKEKVFYVKFGKFV